MNERQFEEQVRIKNRKKLEEQNIKLYKEIESLRKEIDGLEQKGEEKKENHPEITLAKGEIQAQEREIKRLKELIEEGRHANIKQNVIYIRKQEDELLLFKKQLTKMQEEKKVLEHFHQDKVKQLSNNQPLQSHKEEMQSQWTETKRENRELNLKMVEMERQIRRYHSIKQKAKNKNDNKPYEQEQMTQLLKEIQRINQEIKTTESKWKPHLQNMDQEFFNQKNQLLLAQKNVQELEKEEKLWKMRAALLRDQGELQSDKQRLAKVAALPKAEPIKVVEKRKKSYFAQEVETTERKHTYRAYTRSIGEGLPRAQSTPNPPNISKRSLDLSQLNKNIEAKKKQLKKQKLAKTVLEASKQVKLMSPQKKQLDIKGNKQKKAVVISSDSSLNKLNAKIDEKTDTNIKNEDKRVRIREKHRIKSSAASNFAQQIKKKVDDAKKINSDIKKELGSSPSNSLSKLDLPPKVEQKGNGAKINKVAVVPEKQELHKKINEPLSPKLKKQSSNSSIQLKQLTVEVKKEAVNLKKSQSLKKEDKKQKQTISQRVVRQPSAEKTRKKEEKQLIEHINIKKNEEIRALSPKPAKKKDQTVPNQKQSHSIKSKEEKETKTTQKPKSKQTQTAPLSPKSIRKTEQIKFQIVVADRSHSTSPKQSPKSKEKIKIQKSQLEDEGQGVPKIIKRKRPQQGALVNAGTST